MTNFTVREIAEKERITPDTVKRALRNGFLKGHKIGGRGDWRISEEDYLAWIAAGGQSQPKKEQTRE
jgi:excisionase family DNA binding protein